MILVRRSLLKKEKMWCFSVCSKRCCNVDRKYDPNEVVNVKQVSTSDQRMRCAGSAFLYVLVGAQVQVAKCKIGAFPRCTSTEGFDWLQRQ